MSKNPEFRPRPRRQQLRLLYSVVRGLLVGKRTITLRPLPDDAGPHSRLMHLTYKASRSDINITIIVYATVAGIAKTALKNTTGLALRPQ